MNRPIPPILPFLLTIFLVVTTCDTDSPTPLECEKGFLPCEDDTTVCCEVICPENHHPCGPDSTECCFDTPSHEFDWKVDTIGTKGRLRDVAIIDENNIWVVGEFYIPDPDSSFNGTGWETFNAANWLNGKWIYHRILKGAPINGIWAFNKHDIWGINGFPIHWDGNEWKLYHLQKMGVPELSRVSIEKSIWGSSSKNMYFGGGRGELVHYDGHTFQKIDISTNDPITDIWGIVDEETGEQTVYCTVTMYLHESDRKIFKLIGRNAPEEVFNYSRGGIMSIWFDDNSPIYVGGSRLLKYLLEKDKWEEIPLRPYWIWSIRANHKNDLFAAGYQILVHFNGVDWYDYTNLPQSFHHEAMKKVAIKENLVVVVGEENNILMGKRIKE